MNEGMTWLCMKYEVILLSASMCSEKCKTLCSLDEKCDRQKSSGPVGRKGLKPSICLILALSRYILSNKEILHNSTGGKLFPGGKQYSRYTKFMKRFLI